MIQTKHPFEGNQGLIQTYTDVPGKVLFQVETGITYGDSVVDVYPCRYTYQEVDEPVDEPTESIEQNEKDD